MPRSGAAASPCSAPDLDVQGPARFPCGMFVSSFPLLPIHLFRRPPPVLQWFPGLLDRFSQLPGANLRLFLTSPNNNPNSSNSAPSSPEITLVVNSPTAQPAEGQQQEQVRQVQRGRPNIPALFFEIAAAVSPGLPVGVFACGPDALVTDAQNAAMEQGFHFHKEVFLF